MSTQQRAESDACDQCFRRKQSCSKTQPECQRCLASGSSCTYSFGKFMGKPKKSLKNRRQFQKSTDGTSHEAIKATSAENNLKCQMPVADDHPLPSPTLPDSRGGRITTSRSIIHKHRPSTDICVGLSTPVEADVWPWQNSAPSNPYPSKRAFSDSENSQDPSSRPSSIRKRGNTLPACDQCYRFKVKCTKEPGRCQRCVTSGSVCTYSSVTEAEPPVKRRRHEPQIDPALSDKGMYRQDFCNGPN